MCFFTTGCFWWWTPWRRPSLFFCFLLEKREQWSLLWRLFLQRFCYRQVMYYVMARSVLTAIKGVVVGWGKLERKATVAIGR